MKRNDLAPTKWCWKPNLVQWFHSFETGILRIWLAPSTDLLSHKVPKNYQWQFIDLIFKQRIFHFALIHLFDSWFDLQTKTIFNSNFAVYLCGETIIHGKRSLLRMIFQRKEKKMKPQKLLLILETLTMTTIILWYIPSPKKWIARNFLL